MAFRIFHMNKFSRVFNKLSIKSRNELKIWNHLQTIKYLVTDSTLNESDTIKSYTNKILSYATTSNVNFNLLPDSIGDLIEKRANESPNNISYIFPHNGGLSLTFSELSQRVTTLANSLLKIGFIKGDKLAIALPNTVEFAITLLACAKIGVIVVSLNPAYQLVEVEYMLKKTSTKGIVIYDTFKTLNHYEIMKKLCPNLNDSNHGEISSSSLPDLKHIIMINSPLDTNKKEYKGTWRYNDLAEGKIVGNSIDMPDVTMDDPFLILFTSGTTGKPKGVQLKQNGPINTVYYANIASFGLEDGFKTACVPIPLFHMFGLAMGLISPLVSKTVSSVFPFYLPDTLFALKAIEKYKCYSYMASPTLFIDLVNHPERKKYNITTLKNTIIGASTVPTDLLNKMKTELGLKKIIVGYGMTETSLLASQTVYTDSFISQKKAFESIGRPIPFLEAKILNQETGKTIPLNQDGELCLRGFNILKEYYDEPLKTKEAFDQHGWFKTGDICSMDEDGFLYYKSRSKDIIIRGGTNIYPAEVEAFIRTNPKIIDACVFGIPDDRLGEEVAVWIRIKPNTNFTFNELKSFCEGQIAKFKIPKYMKIVDVFPFNPNGKVMRNKIIEIAKDEFKA